jgi:putative membrane protein
VALFDAQGRARIEAAIAEVERRTAGEIVVLTVPASDGYDDLRLLYAGALALIGAALAHLSWPGLGASWLLWVQVAVGALGFAAFGLRPLLRAIVPAARALHAVERRAHEEFLARELFATRDRTGVLLLLSELERKLVILGDRGIHARVQSAGWQQHVDRVAAAIRAGRAADGVCEVIAALGTTLAAALPPRPDDENELPDAVEEEPR